MRENIYIFRYVENGETEERQRRIYAMNEDEAYDSFDLQHASRVPTKIIGLKMLMAGTLEHMAYRAEIAAKARKEGFDQAVKMLGYDKAVKMFGKP